MLSTLFSWNIISSKNHDGVLIIVPGTWSIQSDWHSPDGDFFKSLEYNAKKYNKKVITYIWSGKNSHDARVTASKSLAKLIESYPENIDISLIAHSHGANVCILASQIISNKKIKNFVSLGVPVDEKSYSPCMDKIESLYNFFSLNDFVQSVAGFFKRTYTKQKDIFNIRLRINRNEPTHSQLHDTIVAKHIPDIIFNNVFKNLYSNNEPIVDLFTDKNFKHENDDQREFLLEEDIELNQKLPYLFVRRKKKLLYK